MKFLALIFDLYLNKNYLVDDFLNQPHNDTFNWGDLANNPPRYSQSNCVFHTKTAFPTAPLGDQITVYVVIKCMSR